MKTWITDAQGRKLYTVDAEPKQPKQEPEQRIVECDPTEIVVKLS